MSANRDREEEIFDAARELAAHERAAYLAERCGQDADLRQRIEGMLAADAAAGEFFKTHDVPAPTAVLADASLSPSIEKAGDRIGRYKLLQQIGEGGCGVVYMAEQEEPVRRRVALKVIKLGMDTKQVIARFEAERQALALMDHPNIAKIHDAGITEGRARHSVRAGVESSASGAQGTDAPYLSPGRPYFVMELVRGIKITEFCDENKLSTEDRLKLFIQVCQAIQHAHQKGVIHRDIKPSNILVIINDGVPVPKVIDFGIAKATQGRLTDQTLFTAFEQFIGTPAYMSPEQAVLTSLDIDTRSDIYSLGVLLYELLTSRTPFDQKELLAAGLDAMRRTIREAEPPRPSTRLSTMAADALTATAQHRHTEPPKLLHLVRGDLDWIVMKCLEKDRARRYETANGLAADIQRHLSCEPVVARPPSRLYEFQKTVRRHKFGFAAAGAVILALSIGLGVSMWQFVQKNRAYYRATQAEQEQARQRQIAEMKEKQSQQVAQFLKDMLKSVEPSVALGRDVRMLREILDKTAERVGTNLKDQPEVQSELLSTIGVTYFGLGDSQKAIEIHREALRLRRALFGETNAWVAASLNELGDALELHQDFAEAEAVLRQALAIRRLLLGNNDADTARSMSALAGLLLELPFNLSEAEALQREALAVQTNLFPEGNDDVFLSLNNLGKIVLAQNRLTEAEVVCHEALKLSRKLHGAEHPDVATALTRLGRVLRNQKKLSEAEPWLRDGYLMRRKFLGNDHEYVFSALDSYASLLSQQGKFAEAEAALRENLKQRSTRLEGNLLDDMVTALFGQGKSTEAVELFREELDLRKKMPGDNHYFVESALRKLARALGSAGKPAEAEALYREELDRLRSADGNAVAPANSGLGVVLHHFAELLWEQKKFKEARPHAEEAWTLYQEHLDWSKNEQSHAYQVLHAVLTGLNDQPAIEALQRNELVRLRGKLPPDDPLLASSLAELANSLLAQQKFTEAEAPARESLAIREKKAPDDWRTFNSRSMLGGSLLGQKKYAEAGPLLLAGYEGMKQREKTISLPGKVRIREALQRLSQLHEATGQPGQAAEWNKKLAEFDQAGAEKQVATPKPQSQSQP